MAKGPNAFRTISEAAEEVGVAQHVLRFWEEKFSFIRPMKRAGGRRFYRPQDIAVLRGVRTLLHDEGFTIKGVQKLHKDQGLKRVLSPEDYASHEPHEDHPMADEPLRTQPLAGEDRQRLSLALVDLEAVKDRLDRLLKGDRKD